MKGDDENPNQLKNKLKEVTEVLELGNDRNFHIKHHPENGIEPKGRTFYTESSLEELEAKDETHIKSNL